MATREEREAASPLQILAVGMLDVETFGSDTFFVQQGPDQVMLYEVHRDGTIKPQLPEPQPLRMVTASIEKFNNGYRCEQPVVIADVNELVGYLDRFEITSDTSCRLKG